MNLLRGFLLLVSASAFVHAAQAAGEHAGAHGMQGRSMGEGHQMQHEQSDGHASRAGEPGSAAQATRTIDVVMGVPGEFRYTPDRIEVKAGETVRFRVRSAGSLVHEMVLGDAAELREHAKSMREPVGMAHKEANSLTLDPDKAGELVWKFTNPGEFQFACLVAGHFEAGMKGSAVVN